MEEYEWESSNHIPAIPHWGFSFCNIRIEEVFWGNFVADVVQ